MKFNNFNNHIIVSINNKNYVVDTGSLNSFSLIENSKLEINNHIYNLPFEKLDNSNINSLTGTEVYGFIGMDIIINTGLTIDYSKNEIIFEPTTGHEFAFLDAVNGYCLTGDIVINDNNLKRVYLDTGAYISYVSSRYLKEEDNTGIKYSDWNPRLHDLSGNLYNAKINKVTLGSGSYQHNITVGKLHPLLEHQFDAFINPCELVKDENTIAPNKVVSFDFNNKVIYIK